MCRHLHFYVCLTQFNFLFIFRQQYVNIFGLKKQCNGLKLAHQHPSTSFLSQLHIKCSVNASSNSALANVNAGGKAVHVPPVVFVLKEVDGVSIR